MSNALDSHSLPHKLTDAMSGIYVLAGKPGQGAGGERLVSGPGPLWCDVRGALASRARHEQIEVLFEGILTAGRLADGSDADAALAAYRQGGIEAVRALDGFFQIAVVDHGSQRATIISDPIATRPLFVYRGSNVAAVAPNPMFFHGLGLPMSLDRRGLYELFRLNHPLGGRSLACEVARSQPFAMYELDGEGRVDERGLEPIRKRPDSAMDLDAAADRIRDVTAEVLDGILTHPRLAGRPIHLPLTAGMDSRHILAELLRQDRAPASIRHIQLNQPEFQPVSRMANDLGLPLYAPAIAELDHRELARLWVQRTGASVHFHQLYLMGVANDLPPGGVVGFDGYLADFYLGFYRLRADILHRHYTRVALHFLFSDRDELGAQTIAAAEGELARFDGPITFQLGGSDTFNRGPRYTGSIFPILGDDALYFAPGAHRKAFEFFCTAPEVVADKKRARLYLFRKHFPELGKYPSEYGTNYVDVELQTNPNKWPTKEVMAFVRGTLSRHRSDPAPDTEHAWMRAIPYLRELSRRATFDSDLARDGHLPGRVLRTMWRAHRAGGFLGFSLMSVITAEVSYRLLVKGYSSDDVLDWLGV